MIVRGYREQDFIDIKLKPTTDITVEQLAKLAVGAAHCFSCFTFEQNGRPVAIVGAHRMWDGVAQVWSIVSDEVRGHGLELTKTIKDLLKIVFDTHGIRRGNILVDSSIRENIRWAELLGFKYEFTMEKASPQGKDILGYVYWA